MGANKVTDSSGRNQGKLIITLPTASITSCGESQITVPSSAVIGPSQGNVIMTLPTALICPTPSATLVTPSPFTSLPVKEHMSQRCSTLLKMSMGQKPDLNPLSVASQFVLLPSGCVVTNSTNVNPNHSQQSSAAQESGPENHEGRSLENFSESMRASPALVSVIEGNSVHEEELECGGEDFREPFLTLSESSGSPAPSLSGDEGVITSPASEPSELSLPEPLVSSAVVPTLILQWFKSLL